jgi:hypothetical protein
VNCRFSFGFAYFDGSGKMSEKSIKDVNGEGSGGGKVLFGG